MTQQLVLFDIDGTLVLTGGAGKRGMTRAFEALFGVADAFTAIPLAGRTDTSILADALETHRIPFTSADVAAFRSRYLACLREEVAQTTRGKRVLPGILPLLETLGTSQRSFLGLLTGNYTEAAEVKLSHFDLWRYFRCGAFGEDAHDRNHLVPIALDRARACGLPSDIEIDRVVVVGDTPRDIACAHVHGARMVAVATGEYSAGELRDAGAEVVFEDFSDTRAVLAAIKDIATN
jgi:phosphoglycolate phosphatase-like HAD superfamily hydrolase